MSKSLYAVVAVMLLLSSLGKADEIPRAYRSSSMLGQGGAGVATVQGFDALLHNPANLAEVPEGFAELAILNPQFTYSDDFEKVASDQEKVNELTDKPFDLARYLQGKDLHASFQTFSGASFSHQSAGLIANAHTNFELTNNPITFLPDVAALITLHSGFLYGYGKSFQWLGQDFALGANAKVMQKQEMLLDLKGAELLEKQSRNEKIEFDSEVDSRKGTGFGSDIGLTWSAKNAFAPKVSLVVQNIGYMGYSGGSSAPSPDKQVVTLALASGITSNTHHLQFMLDWEDILNAHKENFFKRLHLGTSYFFDKFAGVNLGINQGYLTYGFQLGFSTGFSLVYAKYSEELGDTPGTQESPRSAVKLNFGWWL